MDRRIVGAWFVDICLGWVMLVFIVLVSKLTYDFVTTPNIFLKKETVLTQKQSDEMCAAWWFDTDIESAKKRICKK